MESGRMRNGGGGKPHAIPEPSMDGAVFGKLAAYWLRLVECCRVPSVLLFSLKRPDMLVC